VNKQVKQHLIEEILTVDAADTESHLLEWQSLNNATTESFKDVNQLNETITNISQAKSASLQAFLERKKMIKQAIEEM
jgi:hypothetical protein